MRITFNEQMGHIVDIFTSLEFIAEDGDDEAFSKYQIKQNEKVERAIEELKESPNMNLEKIRFFFKDETKIFSSLLQIKETWNKNLSEVLDIIRKKGEDEIKYNLVKELTYGMALPEEEIEKINATNESFIVFIKELNISAEGKWNLFLFTQDIKTYLEEFAVLINEYLPIYNKVTKKYSKYAEKEAQYYKDKIEEKGMNFINELLRDVVDAEEGIDEISVSFMFYNCYSIISSTVEKSRYLLIGIRCEELINKICGNTDIENNLLILKNLSDKTRYGILKLLSQRQSYGLELAEQFKLTNATICYHMSYLQFSKLVQIEKKDHKAYYTLNKEELRKCFEFFYKELGLDK